MMKRKATIIPSGDERQLAEQFGRFVRRYTDSSEVIVVVERLCEAVARGQICLDLGRVPEIDGATLAALRATLAASGLVGGDDGGGLLALEGERLYMRRHWEEERGLARAVLDRCQGGDRDPAGKDPEERAMAMVTAGGLSIICGGPGTGKTTLAGKIIARLVKEKAVEPGRIAITAPTGRAARRLGEVLGEQFGRAGAGIPAARTLHALLGLHAHDSRPRFHAANPLSAKLVVADECSMISLSAMRQLFAALGKNAKVLLLGDPSQLASVDAGAVLADFAEASRADGSPLRASFLTLTKNYRFPESSRLHRLASAVRAGQVDEALSVLAKGDGDDLRWRPLPSGAELEKDLERIAREEYGKLLDAGTPEEAYKRLGGFRILTPLRKGPVGVEALNRLVTGAMYPSVRHREQDRLAGMPLMITKNDSGRRLFNGETGVVWGDDGAGDSVWFETGEGELCKHHLAGLPPHELAYATTVHKAQGSEYQRVLILLPEDPGPVVTRELVYTALTRARGQVDLWCSRETLARAVERPTERSSGLAQALLRGEI